MSQGTSTNTHSKFWNFTIVILVIAFLTVWSTALDFYHRDFPSVQSRWWHELGMDAVGSLFTKIARPLSNVIPAGYVADFGGDSIHEFGDLGENYKTRKGVTSVTVRSSLWTYLQFPCTMVIIDLSFLILWLVGGITMQSKPHLRGFYAAIRSSMNVKQKISAYGVIIIMGFITIMGFSLWRNLRIDRAVCTLNIRNYNIYIYSLGVHSNVYSIWANTQATEQYVKDTFEFNMPTCPSGGTYRLVYGRGMHTNIPQLVCSEEKSLSHHFSPKN